MREFDFDIPKYHGPSTPGEILRDLFLDEPTFDFTQKQVAARLGISSRTFTSILTGKRPVTPLMAMRLQRVIGVGAETWLNLQRSVDLYDALHSPEAKQIAKLKPLRPRKRLKRARAA
jgi:addiction module HigA family antidote